MGNKQTEPQSITELKQAEETAKHPRWIIARYNSLWIKLQVTSDPQMQNIIRHYRRWLEDKYYQLTARILI